VLADVFERAEQRAGILAIAADNAHFAGAACQRRYGEAREALTR
jgi:predicted ATPase